MLSRNWLISHSFKYSSTLFKRAWYIEEWLRYFSNHWLLNCLFWHQSIINQRVFKKHKHPHFIYKNLSSIIHLKNIFILIPKKCLFFNLGSNLLLQFIISFYIVEAKLMHINNNNKIHISNIIIQNNEIEEKLNHIPI